jgi:hypothetical protein
MDDKIIHSKPSAPLDPRFDLAVAEASDDGVTAPLLQAVVDFVFERGYLADLASRDLIPDLPELHNTRPLAWRRLERLPVHPRRGADDLLPLRWQRMLTTLHTWDRRFALALVRTGKQTSLYFGTSSRSGDTSNSNAAAQLEQAAAGELAGLRLARLAPNSELEERQIEQQLLKPMARLRECGAITGLPSARAAMMPKPDYRGAADADRDLMSGLGQVAHGIKTAAGSDENFAVVIIADAVPDRDIREIISRLRVIGERAHRAQRTTIQESGGTGTSAGETTGTSQRNSSLGKTIATGGLVAAATALLGSGGGYAAAALTGQMASSKSDTFQSGQSESSGWSASREQIDMVAQHCKILVDRHIERLERGRSLGFWNTGVYVLGQSSDTVVTVCGMLRAAYSGRDSHIEPIRTVLFPRGHEASEYVRAFCQVPFPMRPRAHSTTPKGEWHPLGPLFQEITTPLNTEELGVATALPRGEVPGLRTDKTLVQFALNAPQLPENARPIVLGNLMASGGVEAGSYRFDLNSLLRHGLLVGTTGSGKSTTCRRLILETLRSGVPFLLIEPAKEDYVRWFADYNQAARKNGGEVVYIFMPGAKSLHGEEIKNLAINPFQPMLPPGAEPDLLGRLERVVSVLNASLPMQEAMPIILESAILSLFGNNFDALPNEFPMLERVTDEVRRYLYDKEFPTSDPSPVLKDPFEEARNPTPFIDNAHLRARLPPGIAEQFGGSHRRAPPGRYEDRVRANFFAALENRIDALCRGRRGLVLNVPSSTAPELLFRKPVVVNLSRFGSDADKSLIIALLLIGMCEYRTALYDIDSGYRRAADAGQLQHLAVVEEAHTILREPERLPTGEANAQAAVAKMFSDMLAEMRQYGQGLLVIDQDPSRLITATIKNTSFRVVHKLPHQEDRTRLSATMMLRDDQTDFLAVLPRGHAIVSTEHDDSACWVKIVPEVGFSNETSKVGEAS